MSRPFVVVVLALSACAEALPPDTVCEAPAQVHVTLASGALLNPDTSGAPLPTEVRIVGLRDPGAFENVSFDEAWTPPAPLADTIVATESVTLYPGESAALDVHPSADTRSLAAVAIVRRPAGRTWRVLVPVAALPCGSAATLALRVDEYRIERTTEDPTP